ncbi:MAG TPA: sigma-70 family RNA polymerase sigma factor [Clostridia bacterium]
MKQVIHDENVYNLLVDRDQQALEYLIDKYSGKLFNLVKKIVANYGTKEDIEDIISDLFSELWVGKYKYDKERGNIIAWLYTIARYKALDFVRRNKKVLHKTSLDDYNLVSEIGFEEKIITGEYIEKIINLANELSDLDKKIFLLRYFYYQEIEEISKIFNLSRNNVDVKLHRCRNLLKKRLKGWEENEKK